MLVGACGKPGNWSTWWIVDGGDDTDTLRCVDIRAKLNEQVECVERSFRISFGGGISRDIAQVKQRFGIDRGVEIYLSGDGKAMCSMNFMEGKQSGCHYMQCFPVRGAGCVMFPRISGVQYCDVHRLHFAI